MDFKQLLEDYRNGKMDAAQRAAFEQLLHSMESEQALQQMMDASLQQVEPVLAEETQEYLYERLKENYLKEKRPARVYLLLRYAAAVIIVVVGIAAYFLKNNTGKKDTVAVTQKTEPGDVAPGHDGAVLTLADGRQLVLDSLSNGIIATQNGARVMLSNGALSYDQNGQTSNEIAYNTMHTPKGRQFQLVLPDGSKVCLNAASSIRYPTVFTGDTRTVEINGEAYFEVSRDATKPFIVNIDDTTNVRVLGTHFNINAYDDEAVVKTTLLEGKVELRLLSTGNFPSAGSIILSHSDITMKPGQQAIIGGKKRVIMNDSPDLAQVMAWKNGLFNFNGYDIKAVMREISRWYDLDIVYEAEPEKEEMMGELQRNLTLSQVMKILQKINIKYRIEGRQLIVMK